MKLQDVRALAAAAMFTLAGLGTAAADPLGRWRDKDGTTIRVQHCGRALCGTIVSTKQRLDPETGKPWTDKHNQNAAKRNRPLVGVQVFIAMRPSGAAKWSGRLYDSDQGKFFQGHLIDSGAAVLRVEGCAGGMCGGEDLTRVR
jgi:uncharacterized protein (DUF2147 family)